MPGAGGFLGSSAGASDDGTYIAIARFASEEAARANSRRPEQDGWWQETATCFEGEVSFRESSDVGRVHPVRLLQGSGGTDHARTSEAEAEARAGEAKELPTELQQRREEAFALLQDLRFLDLRETWLISP